MSEKLAFASPPLTQESFSSWLERLAREYEVTASRLLDCLVLDQGQVTFDLDQNASKTLLSRLSALTDISQERLDDTKLREGYWLLPKLRTAVCYQCWLHDLARHTVPYYRKDWALATTVLCPQHGRPLWDFSRHHLSPSNCRKYQRTRQLEMGDTPSLARLKLIQGLFLGPNAQLATASLRRGILKDLTILVYSNFSYENAWGAATQILRMLKLYHGDLSWYPLLTVAGGKLRGPIDRKIFIRHLHEIPTVGHRRLVLFSAFLALPGLVGAMPLAFRECFSKKSLDWIMKRQQRWPAAEISLLMPVARKVVL